MRLPPLTRPVAEYYSRKLLEHGPTARGVDWRDRESQELRFDQVLRVCGEKKGFSVIDWGCGYGALLGYLEKRKKDFRYLGFDLSPEMIRQARRSHPGRARARFKEGWPRRERADYAVASGIFNVKLKTPASAWRNHILKTLRGLDDCSRKGFSFNCLTKYSDREKMRPDLYYADPLFLFDFCKRNFSRNVALLHDYGLYEFTVLVRKP